MQVADSCTRILLAARRACERALALLTGLTGNASAASGQAVDVASLIDPELLREPPS